MSLILGLGSPHGDDQLGWVAVDLMLTRLPAGVSAHKVRDGLDILERLEGHDAVVVIDAATYAGKPGTMRSFAWPCPELAVGGPGTTHGVGLAHALQLAEVLGRLPSSVIVHTIEARSTSPDRGLSDEVAGQVEVLVETILAELIGPASSKP